MCNRTMIVHRVCVCLCVSVCVSVCLCVALKCYTISLFVLYPDGIEYSDIISSTIGTSKNHDVLYVVHGT